MSGARSHSRTRLGLLTGCAALALLAVALRLAWLMFVEGEGWRALSLANQRGFHDVPFGRGDICDRNGQVLVTDEPGYAVGFAYRGFRQSNPIALAVHGVRMAFEAGCQLDPLLEPEHWSLADPAPRLAEAARIVTSLPVRWLRQGARGEARARLLRLEEQCLRLLAAADPDGRSDVELRKALGNANPDLGYAQALGIAAAHVAACIEQAVADLDDLERALDWDRARRGSLRQFLALRDQRLSHLSSSDRDRSRRETSLLLVARAVTFERAAGLLLQRERFAGFEVVHTAQRVRPLPVAESLLGSVAAGTGRQGHAASLEDLFGEESELDAAFGEQEEDLRLALNMNEDEWRTLSGTVKTRLRAAEERRARHGVAGIERDLDEVLQGRLGFRHVQHDKHGRELRELGFEPPASGLDVTLALDLELQQLAEQCLDADPRVNGSGNPDHKPLDAALLILDCHDGDLLALASRPREDTVHDAQSGEDVLVPLAVNPAGTWRTGPGRVGSVLKALVAAEALETTPDLGRDFAPCQQRFAPRSERAGALRCDGVHDDWHRLGTEPVAMALGVSCNVFFYQTALGLGRAGLDRAFVRFGILPDPAAPGVLRDEQRSVAGLRWAATRDREQVMLEQRGIGYGLEISPLAVVRAYAALATGYLVTPRTVIGIEGRPTPPPTRRPLGLAPQTLARVRAGLQVCTGRHGTAGSARLDELGIVGKTGTPEFQDATGSIRNNAWFAGYGPLPEPRFALVCVIYGVPDKVHGGEAAVPAVRQLCERVRASPRLSALLFGTGVGAERPR